VYGNEGENGLPTKASLTSFARSLWNRLELADHLTKSLLNPLSSMPTSKAASVEAFIATRLRHSANVSQHEAAPVAWRATSESRGIPTAYHLFQKDGKLVRKSVLGIYSAGALTSDGNLLPVNSDAIAANLSAEIKRFWMSTTGSLWFRVGCCQKLPTCVWMRMSGPFGIPRNGEMTDCTKDA